MTILDDRLDEFSDRVLDKAHSYATKKKDQIRRDADHPSVFWIRDQYRVQVAEDGRCSCTCPHGMNNTPAHCYHAATALLHLQESGEDYEVAPQEDQAEDDEAEAGAEPADDFESLPDDADEILGLSDADDGEKD